MQNAEIRDKKQKQLDHLIHSLASTERLPTQYLLNLFYLWQKMVFLSLSLEENSSLRNLTFRKSLLPHNI